MLKSQGCFFFFFSISTHHWTYIFPELFKAPRFYAWLVITSSEPIILPVQLGLRIPCTSPHICLCRISSKILTPSSSEPQGLSWCLHHQFLTLPLISMLYHQQTLLSHSSLTLSSSFMNKLNSVGPCGVSLTCTMQTDHPSLPVSCVLTRFIRVVALYFPPWLLSFFTGLWWKTLSESLLKTRADYMEQISFTNWIADTHDLPLPGLGWLLPGIAIYLPVHNFCSLL